MAININADFTCDNSFQIWLGNDHQVQTKVKERNYTSAGSIMGGEHFSFLAYENDYLYIVAWSDDSGVQGLIGSFDGGMKVNTGHPSWMVLPTGNNKNGTSFPTISEINNEISNAIPSDWKTPYVGPTNANTSQLFHNTTSPLANIPLDANWVWHDSENDSSTTPGSYNALPPFKGFNHQEFLIFRIPVKHLMSCCSPCAIEKPEQERLLSENAKRKLFTLKGSENNGKRCKEPYSQESCSMLDLPNLEPCFYLHWGDSKDDQIESHDDEVMYLTVCNPYGNLNFKGLKVSEITISPSPQVLPNGEMDLTIVPDSLICFDNINGCTCASRPVTLLVRGAKPQKYNLTVEYCIDSIEINQFNKGKTSFEIDVVNS